MISHKYIKNSIFRKFMCPSRQLFTSFYTFLHLWFLNKINSKFNNGKTSNSI
jgi:hypothetical protein